MVHIFVSETNISFLLYIESFFFYENFTRCVTFQNKILREKNKLKQYLKSDIPQKLKNQLPLLVLQKKRMYLLNMQILKLETYFCSFNVMDEVDKKSHLSWMDSTNCHTRCCHFQKFEPHLHCRQLS